MAIGLLTADGLIDVEAEMARCRQHGVDVLIEADDAYPRVLREIHDPPGVLFVRGELEPQDGLAVARLDREHGNAINERLVLDLTRVCHEAEADDRVRGVLLAAAGKLLS